MRLNGGTVCLALALVILFSSRASADSFTYSYNFGEGQIVSGSFKGVLFELFPEIHPSVLYVIDITDVTMFFKGEQLPYDFEVVHSVFVNPTGLVELTSNAAYNNFAFLWDDASGTTAYFHMGTETGLGYENVASFHSILGDVVYDLHDQPRISSGIPQWQLTRVEEPAPVPEPSSLLVVVGAITVLIGSRLKNSIAL
jgi:hypothetical protein